MTGKKALIFSVVLLAMVGGDCGAQTVTPHFTIAAANVTMPSNGAGRITFALTSVDGYAGPVVVTCADPTVAAGVQIPNCGSVPVPAPIVLSANGTATGSASLTAVEYVNETKDAGGPKVRGNGGVSWALAGLMMLGIGLRRKRWSSCLLVAVGMTIGLTAVSGCGGGPATLTPGVYAYTLNGYGSNASSTPLQASTTVQVTVPAGIVIQKVNGPPPV